MVVLVFYAISTSYDFDNVRFRAMGHIRESVEGALIFENERQAAKYLGGYERQDRFKDCQVGILKCEDRREWDSHDDLVTHFRPNSEHQECKRCGNCKHYYEAPIDIGRCNNALSGRWHTGPNLQACEYFKEG